VTGNHVSKSEAIHNGRKNKKKQKKPPKKKPTKTTEKHRPKGGEEGTTIHIQYE